MNTIRTIKSGKFSANAYLVQNGTSFVLIDTGSRSRRDIIETKLEEYQCMPGSLKCILLTHGDLDHSGNALYLGRKFKAPVGINKNEAPVLETGNMFVTRKRKPVIISLLFKIFIRTDKFRPDFYLEDGDSIDHYGMDAKVIHTPGHSPGSVCIVTSEGDCFCGDLFTNGSKPKPVNLIDDPADMKASIRKILDHELRTIYPGHGEPFLKKELSL